MTVHSVAVKRPANIPGFLLEIFCKNFRKIEFILEKEESSNACKERLDILGLPGLSLPCHVYLSNHLTATNSINSHSTRP